MNFISLRSRLPDCARSETTKHVAAFGRVEIAILRIFQTWMSHKRAPFQYLMTYAIRQKPRLGIIGVALRLKTRMWRKRCRRPLPNMPG